MKALAYILVLFYLLGCNQEERSNYTQPTNQDSVNVQNCDNNIAHQVQIPDGFRLDTIQIFDTARNLAIIISIPKTGMNEIDKTVFDAIEKQKNDFIISLDEMIKSNIKILGTVNSVFIAEPFSIFTDSQVTSILFIVSYYYGGTSHPVTMHYSFNFDNKTQKRIFFSDYFVIENKADTVFMTDLITRAIGIEGVLITELSDIDFNIEQDTISFNFDSYKIAGYAAGMIKGRIQRQKLNDKISTTYR